MSTKKTLGMGVKELLKIALKEELETVKKDSSDKEQAESEKDFQKKQIDQHGSKRKIKQRVSNEQIKQANSNNYYQQAIQAYKENQILLALIKFAAFLENSPNDPRCWNNLGVILFESGAEQLARECFQKALQLDPENNTARENLAHFEL